MSAWATLPPWPALPIRHLLGSALPYAALVWSGVVIVVICIGVSELFRAFLRSVPRPASATLPQEHAPHVTAIRPVSGLEPLLYECLASTFAQDYPASRLTVYFCVGSRADPAMPTLERLLADFPGRDARIFVEEEDAAAHPGSALGPNPKIRNMSRAYREAKGDVVWIVDCNVWLGAATCGNMADRLCGLGPLAPTKFKFVHQMPVAVDVAGDSAGAALDEMFLSTAHAKFYSAISAVAVAPCICGKSNMFRRAHLDALAPASAPGRAAGIDFFSDNICEDHLIGDLLWKAPVPAAVQRAAALEGRAPPSAAAAPPPPPHRPWGNHAIVACPPCLQPLARVPLRAYAARRARWLRVRKFTVPSATLVEPGTESLLASAGLAYALTRLDWAGRALGVPPTAAGFAAVFACAVAAWCAVDYAVWRLLQGWRQRGEPDAVFGGRERNKGLVWWLKAWAGRELLAFPVWAWAVFGGRTVTWRGRRFKVGMDMKVLAVGEEKKEI